MTLLWALRWYPGHLRSRAHWVRALLVLAILALSPWVGGLLAAACLLLAYRASPPAFGIVHILFEAANNQLWVDLHGARYPLRARWFGRHHIRFGEEPFVVFADEFSPADYARLRRCCRGILAAR